MAGWWMVQVTSPINGDVYFASRAYGSDMAQFEVRGDAEDLAEEVLYYYEEILGRGDVEVSIVFMNEHGLVQGKVMS